METKTIKDVGLAVITLTLLVSLGFNVQPEDTHYCEDRSFTYHCDTLSKYYGLINGKCTNNVLANKVCKSGWIEIQSPGSAADALLICDSTSKEPCKMVSLVRKGVWESDKTYSINFEGVQTSIPMLCMKENGYCEFTVKQENNRSGKFYLSNQECNVTNSFECAQYLIEIK